MTSQAPHSDGYFVPVWRKLKKTQTYLLRGDVQGLNREIQQYLRWRKQRNYVKSIPSETYAAMEASPSHPRSESEYWDEADIDLIRHASWLNSGKGILGQWAIETLCADSQGDIPKVLMNYLGGQPRKGLSGLVLGCGDMMAEYRMFTDPRLQFERIDAHDVSPASLDRARKVTGEAGLNVEYHVSDINTLELASDSYDLIICFYAYHHFQEVNGIAYQINKALRSNGVFYTIDYVGERQQQFSDLKMWYANQLLHLLPARYRRELDGRERTQAQRIPVEFFSPDEAIRSDEILKAIEQNLCVLRQYNWAGLLMPLLEGLGFNFGTSQEDINILRLLFEIDQALVATAKIGPNFTMTIAGKKPV